MTRELTVLLSCCKLSPSKEDVSYIRSQLTDNDSQIIMKLQQKADALGVFPLVYLSLKRYASDLISESIMLYLKQQYFANVKHNMLLTAELIRIIKLLQKNNIQALAFKGPALAQLAYGDITLRQFGDLDILVEKNTVPAIMNILSKESYYPEILLDNEIRDTFFSCVNVIGMVKRNPLIRIEIHWELTAKNYAIDWNGFNCFKNKNYISIENSNLPIPSNQIHLLYLCAHGAKHMYERMEWICDIDRFIRANPDILRPELFVSAQSLGIQRMLLLSLYLCQKLLTLPLPEDLEMNINNNHTVKELAEKIIELQFSNTEKKNNPFITFSILWKMRENHTDRLRYSYRILFTPMVADFEYLNLPKPINFLYPFVRLYRLTVKHLKK